MNVTQKSSLALAVAMALGIMSPITQAVVMLDAEKDAAVADGGPIPFAREEQNEGSALVFKNLIDNRAITTTDNFYSGDLTVWIPMIGSYTITGSDDMTVKLTLTPGVTFASTPYLMCPNKNLVGGVENDIDTKAFGNLDVAAKIADGVGVQGVSVLTPAAPLDTTTPVSGLFFAPSKGGQAYESATFYFDPAKVGGFVTRETSGCLVLFSGAISDGTDAISNLESIETTDAGKDLTGAIDAFSIANPQSIAAVTMTREVTKKEAGAYVTYTAQGTIIKFVTGVTAVVTGTNSVNTFPSVTIDVGKLSKEFLAQENGTTLTRKVVIGHVKLVPGLGIRISNMSGAEWTASTLLDTVTAEVSGPLIAKASQVTLATDAGGGVPVDCTKVLGGAPTASTGTGGTGGGTGGTTTSQAAIITVPQANILGVVGGATPQLDGNGFDVCVEIDGQQFLDDGPISIKLTATGKTLGTSPNQRKGVFDFGDVTSVGAPLTSIGKNGTVIRVLNIPYYKAGVDRPFIRIYNASDKTLTVVGSLYGQDGKLLGKEGSTIAEITAKAVAVLDSAALSTKVTAAEWTGRAWLLIQAPVDKSLFKVQSLVRSPNGALINLSGDAVD